LCYGLDRRYVDPVSSILKTFNLLNFFQLSITINIVKGIFDGITTAQLDEYTANYASTLAAEHPDFATLAGRIAVSNLQKQTSKVFSEAMEELYRNVDPITKQPKPLIAQDVYEIVMNNKEVSY
jgi:hypothetical protein